jgi:hypothetical protein
MAFNSYRSRSNHIKSVNKVQVELFYQATVTHFVIRTLEPLGEYKKARKENKKKKKTVAELEEPDLNKRIYTGINQVTRRIEKYIEAKERQDSDKMPVIFICKREIKPLHLCQHLLYMAALAKIRLVPLPAESEVKLSKALQLNRSSVLLLEVSCFYTYTIVYLF